MSTNVPPCAAVSSQRWKPPVVGQLHLSSLSSSRRSMIRRVLQPTPGELPQHLGVHVPNLERLAANLYRDRPPLRVGGGVPDERPDLIQRRIKVGLRTVVRHDANLRREGQFRAREREATRVRPVCAAMRFRALIGATAL